VQLHGSLLSARFQAAASFSWGPAAARVAWNGGPPLLSLCLGRHTLYSRPLKPRPVRAAAAGRQPPGLPGPLQLRGLLPFGGRFLKVLREETTLERVFISARVGLSGPAGTGRLFGAYAAIRPLFCCDPRVSLQVQPDFSRPVLEGSSEVSIRVDCPLAFGIRMARIILAARAAAPWESPA